MPSKPAVQAVPQPRGALPYLVVKGAGDAIAYYQRVFGAQLTTRLDDPTGSVMHAELAIGPQALMLTEERPQHGSLSPVTLGGSPVTVVLYAPDVDQVVERAVAAGAKLTMPVQDQFWGDRAGNITDPFGHSWFIAAHIEDPTPEEIQQRAKALFASGNC
jgi:PhnB protein